MQISLDRLAAHLDRDLRPVYTVWGDEPLLAQEAADAIRAAARVAGCSERQVHTVQGAHFDWSGLLGASQALSLFADRQLIEIRIPSGKPGKDGSEALQRYCETAASKLAGDIVTLVQLPKLDRTQQASAWFTALDASGVTVRVDPIERKALPQWIAQRLAAQGQRVAGGEAGQRTLAFFADRVEGNLLAAHQEVQKLGLLYPAGELAFEQVESAVLNVARYDVFKLGEAVLAGQVARAMRMLDGLHAEGEAAVLVHWTLSEDIRGLKRVKDAVASGKPLPLALREARERAPVRTRGRRGQRGRAGGAAGGRAGLRRAGQGTAPSGLAGRCLGRPEAPRADGLRTHWRQRAANSRRRSTLGADGATAL